MGKALTAIFLLAAGAGAWLFLSGYYYPCDRPILYKLGEIDPRFNLDTAAAQKDSDEAAELWNQSYGKEIFRADPAARLTINFVYDERQRLAAQVNELEENANTDKAALEAQTRAFQAKLNDFNARVQALNGEIAEWNKKGGAPKDAYDSIIVRQKALQTEEASLRSEAADLKFSVNNFNFQVNQLNNTVDTFNAVISQKPESGLYDGENEIIYIYYVNTAAELTHTLAHELGHARGIDHVDDQDAIMYPYKTGTTSLSAADEQALQKTCAKVSNTEIIRSFYQTWVRSIRDFRGG